MPRIVRGGLIQATLSEPGAALNERPMTPSMGSGLRREAALSTRCATTRYFTLGRPEEGIGLLDM